jgi:hypothetical protein
MPTTTIAALPTRTNTDLADALVALAGLLRLYPKIPDLYSINTFCSFAHPGSFTFTMHPASLEDDEAKVDAVRTFAGLFGPQATIHLSEPIRLTSRGRRALRTVAPFCGHTFELFTSIDAAPTPADNDG